MRVTQPFVLISQAPRSGGTMLMRCLDGHPQLWSIPHEWGSPFLPDFEGGDPWHALYDPKTEGRALNGFRQSKRKLNGEVRSFPFDLSPTEMEQLFRRLLPETREPRDVYDAFLTSYFAAWENYRNRAGEKRWVTGFTPRLLLTTAPFRAFNEIYPDGRIISLIRDPASWYASARVWSPEWADLEDAATYWRRATATAAKWKRAMGERMLIVSFDKLVNDPEREMRRIASWLEIDYDESLIRPTFNSEPIKPNSSYPADSIGIMTDPGRRADLLTTNERERMALLAGDLHHRLTAESHGYRTSTRPTLLSRIGVALRTTVTFRPRG